jgi:hypothetical protein
MSRWRRSRPFSLRAIAPLAVALIVAACSQLPVASRAPSASPEPSASPSPVTFTSQRHGYSISHPAGWEALERPGEFQLAALRPRHPGTDTIGTPESHNFDSNRGIVVIGARDLATGETLEDFTTEASEATRCGPHGQDTSSLGGEPAEVRKFECGGTFWHQFTAVHDGRGYLVWVTRPLRDGFLETFAFTD